MMTNNITPGFMLVQGNKTEELQRLVVEWLRRYPLAPLEQEVLLVQSNGIAQWLKHSLAANRGATHPGCGIAAALETTLPARLQWQAYRAVLGACLHENSLPEESLFDKEPLQWRLMRVLPRLHGDVYAPLRYYLENDSDCRKRYQLSGKLADLFDQYQVYRADWLHDWAAGTEENVPRDQKWQPALWRAIVNDMPASAKNTSRADVHDRFLKAVKKFPGDKRPENWPRRIVVFGVSSLPQQTLEVLAAMASFTQVLFCVHNPCKHYWADTAAHPLLDSWGKQGRDYVRLLEQHDDRKSYEHLFAKNDLKIDLFEDRKEPGTLLEQIQNDILELRSMGEIKKDQRAINPLDKSIAFHIAHSPQREVEILHDQLLHAFASDATLKPRDIMVMVPDINTYAPHIEAVFGQIQPGDARYIPFTLADQGQLQQKPLLQALDKILRIDQSRFLASEVLDFLDVPAIRARFGIAEAQLPVLHRWVREAQIRWGLNAEQRQPLGLPKEMEQNTWSFGLKRMLLGYAVGSAGAWNDIEPFDEVGGLDAAVLGALCDFVHLLEQTWKALGKKTNPENWGRRLRALLQDIFSVKTIEEDLLVALLESRLETWLKLCEQAGLTDELPLSVVRESWLAAIEQPQLNQRFLAGAVNFATLMPMRAIPFKYIGLLGMNHADFPRRKMSSDFDLMARPGHYRPGDRSRREDDRYLFLEALLSARKQLMISWVGRSVKDNTVRPPSALVAQLRDHIEAGWGTVADMTVEHRLQPFSRDYFTGQDGFFTYANEWRVAHEAATVVQSAPASAHSDVPENDPPAVMRITLKNLSDFLKNPAEAYFKQVLNIDMGDRSSTPEDTEYFSYDGLQEWMLTDDLLQVPAAVIRDQTKSLSPNNNVLNVLLDHEVNKRQGEGKLPCAGFGAVKAIELKSKIQAQLERYQRELNGAVPQEAIAIQVTYGNAELNDTVVEPYKKDEKIFRLVLSASDLKQGKELKYYHLIKEWPAHLALNAGGSPVETVIVHQGDVTHTIPPLGTDDAKKYLDELLRHYLAGREKPLAVACKSAFAWLSNEKNTDKAAERYDPAYRAEGEVGESAVLAREWPDFHSLKKAGQFEHLAESLYEPLYRIIKVGDA